ncbi:MAG: NAD(P)/FAD-dependent oxidoreductase [Candidatus Rokubacteria bacterium]|nr:NAD(P)/FAD-dependent oxidoreductase [Candidatus Rokubacteria bacterium]
MAGKRILILGGGFGGLTAANALRRALDSSHTITLIDRRREFMMGLRKLWILTGQSDRESGTRSLELLRAKGVEVVFEEITAIDPKARAVETRGGRLEGDYLVIALGAELTAQAVQNFVGLGYNLYEIGDVERLAARLQTFRQGRLAIGILGLPYKCPPAPYEAAFLLHDLFATRKVREGIEMTVFTPQPTALPVAGAAASALVEERLRAKGIRFLPSRKAVRLDADRSQVIFESGEPLAFDLLAGVPAHRCPQIVKESGLTQGGDWVVVDPKTLKSGFERVFAVGDVTNIPLANKQNLPKAGVMAEAQAHVVAAGIAAEIQGRAAEKEFDGRGYCFLEVGGGEAVAVQGNFFVVPSPEVELTRPSATAYGEKRAFEAVRLRQWF